MAKPRSECDGPTSADRWVPLRGREIASKALFWLVFGIRAALNRALTLFADGRGPARLPVQEVALGLSEVLIRAPLVPKCTES
ncbi:MAG: hypothetical protein ACR2M1_12950 [Gemmatimonadaceae bacterium]